MSGVIIAQPRSVTLSPENRAKLVTTPHNLADLCTWLSDLAGEQVKPVTHHWLTFVASQSYSFHLRFVRNGYIVESRRR